MRELLEELNKTAGVRGSMISTPDGIVVASELQMGMEEEVLAAVGSSLTTLMHKVFGHLELGAFQRVVLSFEEGWIIIVVAGEANLIVVARKETNLGLLLLEVDGAARKVEKAEEVTG